LRVQASCIVASLLLGGGAFAQTSAPPNFSYTEAPKEDAKETGWKVDAKAGLIWLAGNAQSTSISAGLNVARDALWQRYSLAANYAFAQSTIYVLPRGVVSKEISSIDELETQNSLAARLWNVTPRFDQWLIRNKARGDTSVYVAGNIASDYAAGKRLFGGGQAGVSNLLLKADGHALIGELGYDFTYLEPYTTPAYSIHSLRVALRYNWDISKATKFNAGVEYLINLNKETGAPNDDPNEPNDVPAFQDHRVNMVIGLTTQIYERLSLLLSWQGHYDAKPQLFSPPPGVTFTPPGVFLKKFDSITQVQFVYTFL
jgi:hypothetical protein